MEPLGTVLRRSTSVGRWWSISFSVWSPAADFGRSAEVAPVFRGRSLKRYLLSSSLGCEEEKVNLCLRGEAMPSAADFEACLRVAEFGKRLLSRWDTRGLLTSQGRNPLEDRNLWPYADLLNKCDKLNACMEFLAKAHEEAERHQRERVELHAQLDRLEMAPANVDTMCAEVAELLEKPKPAT